MAFQKITQPLAPLATLRAVAGGGVTVVSGNTLDSTVLDARKKGYEIDIITNKKEVSTREELSKLVADEDKRRTQEVNRLINDSKK